MGLLESICHCISVQITAGILIELPVSVCFSVLHMSFWCPAWVNVRGCLVVSQLSDVFSVVCFLILCLYSLIRIKFGLSCSRHSFPSSVFKACVCFLLWMWRSTPLCRVWCDFVALTIRPPVRSSTHLAPATQTRGRPPGAWRPNTRWRSWAWASTRSGTRTIHWPLKSPWRTRYVCGLQTGLCNR